MKATDCRWPIGSPKASPLVDVRDDVVEDRLAGAHPQRAPGQAGQPDALGVRRAVDGSEHRSRGHLGPGHPQPGRGTRTHPHGRLGDHLHAARGSLHDDQCRTVLQQHSHDEDGGVARRRAPATSRRQQVAVPSRTGHGSPAASRRTAPWARSARGPRGCGRPPAPGAAASRCSGGAPAGHRGGHDAGASTATASPMSPWAERLGHQGRCHHGGAGPRPPRSSGTPSSPKPDLARPAASRSGGRTLVGPPRQPPDAVGGGEVPRHGDQLPLVVGGGQVERHDRSVTRSCRLGRRHAGRPSLGSAPCRTPPRPRRCPPGASSARSPAGGTR